MPELPVAEGIDFESFKGIYRHPFDRKLVDGLKPEEITWNQHIRGLFTLNQAKCMEEYVNLTNYEQIRDPKVNEMITEKKMPKFNPWPDYQIKLFNKWVKGGYKEGPKVNSDIPNTKIMHPP